MGSTLECPLDFIRLIFSADPIYTTTLLESLHQKNRQSETNSVLNVFKLGFESSL